MYLSLDKALSLALAFRPYLLYKGLQLPSCSCDDMKRNLIKFKRNKNYLYNSFSSQHCFTAHNKVFFSYISYHLQTSPRTDVQFLSQANGQTDRQTDRQTHTHTHTERQISRQTYIHAARQRNRYKEKQTDRQTDRS